MYIDNRSANGAEIIRALRPCGSKPQFSIPSIEAVLGLDSLRLGDRISLNAQLDRLSRAVDARGVMDSLDHFQQQAIEVLTRGVARTALDLDRESESHGSP